jgi:hypothetical protein
LPVPEPPAPTRDSRVFRRNPQSYNDVSAAGNHSQHHQGDQVGSIAEGWVVTGSAVLAAACASSVLPNPTRDTTTADIANAVRTPMASPAIRLPDGICPTTRTSHASHTHHLLGSYKKRWHTLPALAAQTHGRTPRIYIRWRSIKSPSHLLPLLPTGARTAQGLVSPLWRILARDSWPSWR